MMFRKPTVPVRLKRIQSRPTIADLHEFLLLCQKDRETKFSYFWMKDKGAEFMIHVKFAPNAAEWRMFAGAGENARELWFYVSNDTAHIYQMMIGALGEDLQTAMKTDGVAAPRKPDVSASTNFASMPAEMGASTFDRVPIVQDPLMRRPPPAAPQGGALSGDLSVVHITNVLQSVSLGGMTGRLKIDSGRGQIEVFFEKGAPVHAFGFNGTGTECFLLTLSCKEGTFHFEPSLKTEERSITGGINMLMMQGVQLMDNTDYLRNEGVTNDSIIAKKNPGLSESGFEQMMSRGEPIDMSLLKTFYLAINERTSLKDILAKFNWSRSQWVPVVANLVRCGAVEAQAAVQKKLIIAEPKRIDRMAVENVARQMIRNDTGIMSFHAFVYLMERQVALRTANSGPVSFIVFEVQMPAAKTGMIGHNTNLPPAAISELRRRVEQLIGPTDTFAHFDQHDWVIALSESNTTAAQIIAERIVNAIRASHLAPGLIEVAIAFGIATLPDDTADLPRVLWAGEAAKMRARTGNVAIFRACDLND